MLRESPLKMGSSRWLTMSWLRPSTTSPISSSNWSSTSTPMRMVWGALAAWCTAAVAAGWDGAGTETTEAGAGGGGGVACGTEVLSESGISGTDSVGGSGSEAADSSEFVAEAALASRVAFNFPESSDTSSPWPRSSRSSIPSRVSVVLSSRSTSGGVTGISPSRTFDISDSPMWAKPPRVVSWKKPEAPLTVWMARNSSFRVSGSGLSSRAKSFFWASSRFSRLSTTNPSRSSLVSASIGLRQ